MSITDAIAVANTFPNTTIKTSVGNYPLPVVMVAIAGAESSFDPKAKGDYGYSGPTCDGSTSWGLWQIHNSHSAYLTKQTGSTNPCTWEQWCFDPGNNAKAALAVINGFPNVQTAVENTWQTTWNNNKYVPFLSQAQEGMGVTPSAPTTVSVTSVVSPLSTISTGKLDEYAVIGFVGILAILMLREGYAIFRSL